MNAKEIQLPWEGNPLYPLPPDYEDLTLDGQRLARINACRQWTIPSKDPLIRGARLIESGKFFDFYYLWPDPEADFDPLFYDDPPLAWPEMHEEILYQEANSRASLVIAPRGSAKSTLRRKMVALKMLSKPGYSLAYITSSQDNVMDTGSKIKDQLYNNERIHEDWAPEPEFNGKIMPSRGTLSTGTSMFYLTNRASLRLASINSRLRGLRPKEFTIDDPEYDPKASTPMEIIRKDMDTLIFKVVMNMVMRRHSRVNWLATFVSKQHYAYHAMEMVTNSEGQQVSKDPRFGLWSRMIIKAAYEKQGKLVSCWPEMWPLTIADKKADPALADTVSLEEIKMAVGPASFRSEYLADPGGGEESFFPEPTVESHGWWVEDVDESYLHTPWNSSAKICYHHKGEKKKIPCHQVWQDWRLFMCVDTSYTSGPDSDYKVCTVFARGYDNILFVLDIWGARTRQEVLVKKIFELAQKWKVGSIHPELVKGSYPLYETLEAILSTQMVRDMGFTHQPRLVPYKPPNTIAKEDRIAALVDRFTYSLIKMPLDFRDQKHWRMLFDQLEGFNPDARDGGLSNDDHLDTLSMASTGVMKGRLMQVRDEKAPTRDRLELLEEGETEDPDSKLPIILGYNLHEIPIGRLNTVLDSEQEPRGGTRI